MSIIRYQRKPEVLQLSGISNSTLHIRINQGLFVPPVNLGARAVGFLEHEVHQILVARAQGKSNDEIKKIVKRLIQERETLAKAGGA